MPLRPPKRFWKAKTGNRDDEYEDASRVVYPVGKGGLNTAKAALSDGATESAFSREWAQILTRAFIKGSPGPGISVPTQCSLESWLEPCQGEWDKVVPWDRLPWHGEAKSRAGALATLLGLTIAPSNSRILSWQAVAIGDSCLFLVRQDEMLLSFPLEDAAQFNNSPALICSNPVNNRRLREQVRQLQGECAPGDLFILASDDLSRWILERYVAGEKPWEPLLALESKAQWTDWIRAQRNERLMRNDDTTLVIIKLA